MKDYNLKAKVDRQVSDDIVMKVTAKNETEALGKAERALNVFPDSHDESGIPVMYIRSRQVNSLEVVSLEVECLT